MRTGTQKEYIFNYVNENKDTLNAKTDIQMIMDKFGISKNNAYVQYHAARKALGLPIRARQSKRVSGRGPARDARGRFVKKH